MSTKPRLPGADGEAPNFGSVMAHAGELMAAFGQVYGEFWQNGNTSAEIKELTRIRNARITDCGY